MYVHSLELNQIKAFESLDLDFSRPDGEKSYAGMNVFVGGNASGKTTLLRCLALVMLGSEIRSHFVVSRAQWIRRGTQESSIRVFASNGTSDHATLVRHIVRFSVRSFQSIDQQPLIIPTESFVEGPLDGFIAGYGAFRRLSGSSTEAQRDATGPTQIASCLTLFREDAALAESDTWLRQERARELERKELGYAETRLVDQIKEFLNGGLMPPGFRIDRVTVDEVFIQTPNGGELPIRDLSDGIRSTYALALDIIHHMTRTYNTADLFAEHKDGYTYVRLSGVVLIDELEAHLHPSWQQRICEWLKTRFPNIQFFVTTHSPLIAQAADPGGLFVLPLPDEIMSGQTVRRLEPHEQERVALGRAEKVLLGQAFGLRHTWSERANQLVKRWKHLTAQRHSGKPLPEEEQKELDQLSDQMEIIFDDDPIEVAHALVSS